MILPALLLALDEYSSWRLGRVVLMIHSAIQTTLRSLLRSVLVSKLNQTVIDVHLNQSPRFRCFVCVCVSRIPSFWDCNHSIQTILKC